MVLPKCVLSFKTFNGYKSERSDYNMLEKILFPKPMLLLSLEKLWLKKKDQIYVND